MKTFEVKLTSGIKATLFISGHLVVHETSGNPGTCRIVDSVHMNGGWHVDEPYSVVVARLNALLNEQPSTAGALQTLVEQVTAPVIEAPVVEEKPVVEAPVAEPVKQTKTK